MRVVRACLPSVLLEQLNPVGLSAERLSRPALLEVFAFSLPPSPVELSVYVERLGVPTSAVSNGSSIRRGPRK